jgi:hypothetical protein
MGGRHLERGGNLGAGDDGCVVDGGGDGLVYSEGACGEYMESQQEVQIWTHHLPDAAEVPHPIPEPYSLLAEA